MNTRTLTHAVVAAAVLVLTFALRGAGAAVDAKTAVDALYKDGVAAFRQENYKAALAQFRTLEEKYTNSAHSVRSLEYIAQCENKLNDPYAAFEAYQAIWDKHKDFSRLPVITRNQMKIGNYLLSSQNYKRAIDVYQKILMNAPYSDVAPAAQYSLAQAYIGEGDYEAAKTELAKVIKSYPTSQLVDDASYEIGRICYVQSTDAPHDQEATSDAIAAFRRFISDFPSSPKVTDAQRCIRELRGRRAAALLRTGQFYENVQTPKAAEITYRELIEQYPDTAEADEGRTRLAALGGKAVPKSLPRAVAQPGTGAAAAPVKTAAAPARLTPKAVPMPATQAQDEARKRVQEARIRALMQDPATSNALKRELKARYMDDIKQAKLAKALLGNARKGEKTSTRSGQAQMRQPESAETSEPVTQPVREDAVYGQGGRGGSLVDEATEPAVIPVPSRPVTSVESAEAAEPATTVVPVRKTTGDKKPVAATVEKPTRAGTAVDMKPVDGLSMSEEGEATASATAEPTSVGTSAKGPDQTTQLLKDVMVEEPEDAAGDDRAAAVERLKKELATVKDAATERDDEAAEAAEPATGAEEQGETTRTAKDTTEGEEGNAPQLATDTRVRRAKYDDTTTTPVEGSAYSNEDLKQEYSPIFYLIQSGDEKMKRGMTTEAKREYEKALDRLQKLRDKAPTWQAEIVQYRMDYCRERMKSVQ